MDSLTLVLTEFVTATTGPVLEMGAGTGSTSVLHRICAPTQRRLVSAETDPEWIEKLKGFVEPWHEFYLVDEKRWEDFKLIEQVEWAFALVDCKPGHNRFDHVARLINHARYVAIHDTEQDGLPDNARRFHYKYCVDYKQSRPWTSVVSATHDPQEILKG